MLGKLKHFKSITWMMIVMMMLSSCNYDGQLAEDASGCWTYGFKTSYDDGSKTETHVYINLKKDVNQNGGDFMESTVSSANYRHEGDPYTVPYCTTIEGTWEILDGDLYQKYDISTLQVNAYQDSIKATSYENAFAIAFMSQYISKSFYLGQVANQFNKDMYKKMFHEYKDYNDNGIVCLDVAVVDSVLYFDTGDLGRVECGKINGDMPGTEFLQNN